MIEIRHGLPIGHIIAGDYRVESYLGTGGFGITYHAIDIELGHDVAIKEYFPKSFAMRESDTSVHASSAGDEEDFEWGLNRFLQEARTLVKLDHPNVVRATRFLRENNTAYLVQEFLAGRDMEAWLAKRSRRPRQSELDKILFPILDALELVHENNILHRDIKPANIFIRKEDNSPVLIDFGASRLSIGEHTGTTAMIASPGYSPSEAYSGKASLQGPWSDIYSMAATLYRALSGKAPSDATSRMIEDDYVPAAEVVGKSTSYRPGFLDAIDWGLSVMHKDRPQSVKEFREALLADDSGASTTETRLAASSPSSTDETRVVQSAPTSAPDTQSAAASSLEANHDAEESKGNGKGFAIAAAIILTLAGAGGGYYLFQDGLEKSAGAPASSGSAGKTTRKDNVSVVEDNRAEQAEQARLREEQAKRDKAARLAEEERIKQIAQAARPDPGVTDCDRLAADWPDPKAVARVVDWNSLDADAAVPACRASVKQYPGIDRFKHQLAYALDKQGKSKEAVALFRELAAGGYRSSMRRLGIAYYNGSGIAKNEKRGIDWLTRAELGGDGRAAGILAERFETGGDTITKDKIISDGWYQKALERYRDDARAKLFHAAYKIGEYHEFGYGVPVNLATAQEWYLRGARDDNDPAAMERLGLIYQHGRGTNTDYGEALKWYRRAASQNSSLAMNQLGWLYHQGLGVAKDERTAVAWYTRAAEAGNSTAMANLAWSYDYGSGTSADHKKAAEWYLKAFLNGEKLEDVTPEAGKIVQQTLKSRGFFNGTINGVWGETTKQALQAYFDDVNR